MRRLALAALSIACPLAAHADGAFPDSLGIFAPEDRPGRIVLATNFGLVTSDDDGASWRYLCEEAIAPNAYNYQIGRAPERLMAAASFVALALSRDDGCTWERIGGALADTEVTDPFPDPSAGGRLLVIGRPKTTTGTFALYESTDAAASFPRRLLVAERGMTLQSVEIARADPARIAVTAWAEFPPHPYVFTSTDSGASFERHDAAPGLGLRVAAITAVDRADPLKIYFRVFSSGGAGDALGISEDGGRTTRVLVELEAKMSAFLVRSDGALIVGTLGAQQLISTDGGRTFQQWEGAPHLRALAERDGAIYAATDSLLDGHIAAVQRGGTWTPLLDLRALEDFVACPAMDWTAVCTGPLAVAKSRLFEPADGGADPVSDAGDPTPKPPPDCDCTAVATTPGAWLVVALLVLVLRRRP